MRKEDVYVILGHFRLCPVSGATQWSSGWCRGLTERGLLHVLRVSPRTLVQYLPQSKNMM